MKKKSNTIYKRNFLEKVILRFDFDKIDLDFLNEFSKEIEAYFPIQSQEEANDVQIILNQDSGSVQNQKTPFWSYRDINKNKILHISSTHCLIEYSNNSYINIDTLIRDIETILNPFFKKSEINIFNRVGLRYVNRLEFTKKENFKWENFVNRKLLQSLTFVSKFSKQIKRKLEKIEIIKDNKHINLTHGIINKDYPSINVRKEYLLDIDAYSAYPLELELLIDSIKDYNLNIQNIFEESITDETRNILNKK